MTSDVLPVIKSSCRHIERLPMRNSVLFLIVIILNGCMGMPEKVTPVSGFELDKYLGKWYEVARLDHSFERGLEQVTAEYSLRSDGVLRS